MYVLNSVLNLCKLIVGLQILLKFQKYFYLYLFQNIILLLNKYSQNEELFMST